MNGKRIYFYITDVETMHHCMTISTVQLNLTHNSTSNYIYQESNERGIVAARKYCSYSYVESDDSHVLHGELHRDDVQ